MIHTGVVTNTNVSESKHREIKYSATSTAGKNNLVHIWRCTNDNLALKALADGARWSASGWDGSSWVSKTVEAGDLCQAALRELFTILPLAPARSEDGAVSASSNPYGFVSWEANLLREGGGGGGGGGASIPGWQRKVSTALPTVPGLLALYEEKLSCNRSAAVPQPCESSTCARCWRNRAHGLEHESVVCFNHWGGAAPEASAGMGTLRGGPVKAAGNWSDNRWMLADLSRGNDVELYLDKAAQSSESRGLNSTTLGKLLFFFSHRGNDLRMEEGSNDVFEGDLTTWCAVLEYVTAARGNGRMVDPGTGCDVFKLRKTVKYFPASSIRSMVHMVHLCVSSGASPCGLVRKNDVLEWQCSIQDGSRYLLNKCFHSFGRGPIA